VGLYGVGFRPQPFDLNDDETVDEDDTQIVLNVFLGIELDPVRVARSDLNGDLVVDVLDVQLHGNMVVRAQEIG